MTYNVIEKKKKNSTQSYFETNVMTNPENTFTLLLFSLFKKLLQRTNNTFRDVLKKL